MLVQKAAAAAAAAAGAAGDDKAAATPTTTAKMSDFRSKFEKFGGSGGAAGTGTVKPGTPAPFRRNSAAADVTAPAPATDKSVPPSAGKDLLTDLQKQLVDAEKARVRDRQELLDKLAAQKKDFDEELHEMKKKNKRVRSYPRGRCLLVLS